METKFLGNRIGKTVKRRQADVTNVTSILYLVDEIITDESSLIIPMFAVENRRGREKHFDFLTGGIS